MRNNRFQLLFAALASLILVGAGPATEQDEQRGLLEQQKLLQEKVERLKQGQDFLLFQRAFYASDSRYLLLDLPAGTGTLKYRNRTLRTFDFTRKGRPDRLPDAGVIILTAKKDGSARNRMLIFGDSLIIQSKRSNGPAVRGTKDMPRILISTKDLAALYYAVEPGSRLVIVR